MLRPMLRLVREHLIAKLSLLVLLAVAAGFAGFAALSVAAEVEAMQAMNRDSATALARTVAAAVRNAMLDGDGLRVRELLDDAKEGLEGASIRIYAPSGAEVFAPRGPAPATPPAHVAAAVHSGAAVPGPDGARSLPIPNAPACRTCHTTGEVRGVLTASTAGAAVRLDGSDPGIEALASIAGAGFVQIMTAEQAGGLDAYFEELAKDTPGVAAVTVFDADGRPAFGDTALRPPPALLQRALAPGPPAVLRDGERAFGAVPLVNEPRCQGCHGPTPAMRGALLVEVRPGELAGEQTLLKLSDTSLRHVMLSGLGSLVTRQLDHIAGTKTVTSLSLHDAEGRLYHDAFATPAPPEGVVEALKTAAPVVRVDEQGDRGTFTLADPLANEPRCQRCHGGDLPLRGAIEVALDTTPEVQARQAMSDRSVLFAGVTIVLVVLALTLTLRFTVIRPVREMGAVADRVGDGQLDVSLDVGSLDEMGRLAQHLNEMVRGLRQRLALTRFVSEETVRSVADGAVVRGGERRRMAVLFSDVRGFTAFSEAHEPEEVVEMLNRVLHAQAVVVARHGGDIDKFVGDAMMARFGGPDAGRRAALCAVEIVEAVREGGTGDITIGVGVNEGEVVLGAVGAESRMDFTVIGDAVNLASRLCSAAGAGQVLVSASVAAQAEAVVQLTALAPIQVKGKSEPIPIYDAEPLTPRAAAAGGGA